MMRRLHSRRSSSAFTLLEVILAGVIAASIFAAIFTAFSNEIHLRRNVAERSRQMQLRARALNVLRDDLRGGYISGGVLAVTLIGSKTAQNSKFPGYLRLTTTTGVVNTGPNNSAGSSTFSGSSSSATSRNGQSNLPAGDVQEVEYYIVSDPNGGSPDAGVLVRIPNQDLLTTLSQTNAQQNLLTGVTSFEVNFWDGQNWTDAWDSANGGGGGLGSSSSSTAASSTDDPDSTSTTTATLPQAVRVRIIQAPTATGLQLPPLELIVPWTTQPSVSSASAAATDSTTGNP